ncbi:MAG: hypothetical protein K2W95_21030 [Candidatus Obscuribacterales bacterium]|nr:hypothetical protein [Candidatus Obscuribacterales bacterium]
MKRTELAAAVAALVMSFGVVAPAMAADGDALDNVVGASMWPVRISAVGAGTVVGTPVAAVRQTVKAYRDWTPALADKVGGKDFGPSCGLVSLVTLPAAVVWGGVTGPYYGTKNGFVHGFNEPFTHQSFSMGDDYAGKE